LFLSVASVMFSGPERICKWGAPVQRESGGTHAARSAGKNILVVPRHILAVKAQVLF